MEIETTIAARQYRLMEWADQIRDCQSRPNGMSVDEWCHTHEISLRRIIITGFRKSAKPVWIKCRKSRYIKALFLCRWSS